MFEVYPVFKHTQLNNTSLQTQGTQQQLRWSVQLKKQHLQNPKTNLHTHLECGPIDTPQCPRQICRHHHMTKYMQLTPWTRKIESHREVKLSRYRALRFIKHPWQMDIQKLRTAGTNKRCGYYSQKYVKDSFSHRQNIIEWINEMDTWYQDLCEVPTFQNRTHSINASATNVSRTVLLCVLLALAALAPENSGASPSHTIRVLPATLTMSKFLYQENILMYRACILHWPWLS